jgi:hemerythrin superfamily protein
MSIFLEMLTEHAMLKERMLDAKELGDDPGDRTALLRDIRLNLLAHAQAEEETLYARMAQADHDDVLEGAEEHHVMDGIVEELVALPVSDEHWSAKMEVLRETVLHHLREEEESLFPHAEKIIDADESAALGAAYREAFTAAWKVMEDSEPTTG